MKFAHLGLCYLASPYSHPSAEVRHERFVAAAKASKELMSRGVLVFSPILHSVPIVEHAGGGTAWEDWAEYDKALIRRCSALLVLQIGGWVDSVGVGAEIEFANDWEIPVVGVSVCDYDSAVAYLVGRLS